MKDSGTFLLLLIGAGVAYYFYAQSQSTTTPTQVVTTGTTANPITFPGETTPQLTATGPLTNAPQGPSGFGCYSWEDQGV
jgi:hypothetical protein